MNLNIYSIMLPLRYPIPSHHHALLVTRSLVLLYRLTSPDSGAWGLVGSALALVDVDLVPISSGTYKNRGKIRTHHDTGVRLGSVGGDGGQEVGGGSSGTGAGNLDLGALGVELGSVGLVESEQLVADEVVAGLEAGGDLAGPLEVLVDEGGTPVVAVEGVAPQTHLVDLEPLLALAVAGGELAVARVQPHHHGTLLVSPLLPDGGDVGAGGDLGGERGGSATVAGHLRVGHGHDGVVVGPLSLDDLGAGDGGESLVTLVGLTADDVAGDRTVGGDQGRGEEQRKGEVHLD